MIANCRSIGMIDNVPYGPEAGQVPTEEQEILMRTRKTERYMARENLPDFLRQLADALEGRDSEGLECPNNFIKLKLTAREEYGQMTVKLKAGPDDLESCIGSEDLAPAASAPTSSAPRTEELSYKALKKRMKNSFRVIFRMLHDGQIPPEAAVQEFIEDSRTMTTHKGYGDEYYAEYDTATRRFADAYAAKNMTALHDAVDRLQFLKSHCHARFK